MSPLDTTEVFVNSRIRSPEGNDGSVRLVIDNYIEIEWDDDTVTQHHKASSSQFDVLSFDDLTNQIAALKVLRSQHDVAISRLDQMIAAERDKCQNLQA